MEKNALQYSMQTLEAKCIKTRNLLKTKIYLNILGYVNSEAKCIKISRRTTFS